MQEGILPVAGYGCIDIFDQKCTHRIPPFGMITGVSGMITGAVAVFLPQ
jgi:hypothetical protein